MPRMMATLPPDRPNSREGSELSQDRTNKSIDLSQTAIWNDSPGEPAILG
jgi:hypothetical protein